LVAWLCIGLQIVPSLASLVALPTFAEGKTPQREEIHQPSTVPNETGRNPFEQGIASGAVTLGTALSDEDRSSSEALSDYARGQAGSLMNSTVEGWLKQFGTVSSQINLNDDFSLGESSLDWLVPLYDSPKNMLFAQLGARHKDERNTVNMGMGLRYFPTGKMMYGVNTFFDNDLTGKNYRLGVGGELWMDYLQMSTNVYQRLSDWHQSRDFEDYDERPANGFDLRVNGFLPAYPQLGGKLMYEQYFGDEVALFGKDDRQKDPYAVTMGVNYTPIPMLTVGAEQRMGKSGQNDFSVNMDFSYQLDRSWTENTSPEAVDALRQLARSRYDLVDRNNDIILEYRKQQVIKLHLSDDSIKGQGNSIQAVTAQISSKHALESINWEGGSFIAAGGAITAQDKTHFSVTLPAYQIAQVAQAAKKAVKSTSSDASRILNTYVLTAVAKDVKDNESSPAQLTIEVLPSQAHFSGEATVQNDYAPPDGTTPVSVIYSIVDDSNKPLANEPVTFTITLPDGTTSSKVIQSDAKGNTTLPVSSLTPGEGTVVASLDSGDSSTVKVHFTDSKPDAKHSALVANPDKIIANNRDNSILTLTLKDVLGRPLGGLGDSIELTSSGVSDIDIGRGKENSEGVYTAPMSGSSTGVVTVGVKFNGEVLDGVTAQVTLSGDSDTAHISSGDLTVSVNNQVADGKTANQVQAKVVDENNTPVVGERVDFSVDSGAKITASAMTDSSGLAIASVTSLTMGDANVTATVKNSSQSVPVTFKANDGTAGLLAGSLSVGQDNAIANGGASNQVQATVTDEGNNPVAGIVVAFTATNGATFSADEVETDNKGIAKAYLQNTKTGVANVTATVNSSSQNIDTHFIANKITANGELDIIKNYATADGVTPNEIELQIVDGKKNPVANVNVTVNATGGAILEHTAGHTDENGIARTTLTSTKSGTTIVTAKAENGETLSERLTFTPDSGSATLLEGDLTLLSDGAVANGLASNRVQAKVTDANGNPVDNYDVTFTASNGATINSAVKTNSKGIAIASLQNTVVGISQVTATAKGVSQHIDTQFIADKSTGRGVLTADDRHAIANGSETNSVKLTLKDANDNPLSGVAVAFTASNSALPVTPSGMTDAKGELSTDVTSTKAGTSTITAKVASGETLTVPVNFVADSSNATILDGNLTLKRDNVVANKRSSNVVQAYITDENSNPVSGQVVTFTADNNAIISESATTDASGLITVGLISAVAGISKVTATVNGHTQSIDTHFIADNSSATGQLKAVDNNRKADGLATNSVQLTITDANNNAITGMNITFTASNGVTVTSPDGQTDASGQLSTTLTSTKAVTSTITAKAANGETLNTSVTFVADGNSATLADGSLKLLSDNALANGSARNVVVATVTDANGNPVEGMNIDFVASNGATISSPMVTDKQGKASTGLSSTKAGISVVTATVNNNSLGIDTHFQADQSSAQGSLDVTKGVAVADGNDTADVLLTLTDANDNPLVGKAITFSATNGASAVTASGSTDDNGQLSASFTSTRAVSSTVTARAINGATLTAGISFTPDESSATIVDGNLSVISNNAAANGSASNRVKVLVTDANNNPVPRTKVTLVATHGAAITPDVTTDSNGQAIATLQNTVAGLSRVTATVNGHNQSVDTTFIADNATAKGSLTIVKDNAIANGSDTDNAQVTLVDANSNPLPNVGITFAITEGVSVTTPSGVTDENGQFSTTLTSSKALTSTLTASAANGETLSKSVTFIADGGSATIGAGALTLLNDGAVANGSSSNRVQAYVTDANNNPVPNIDVTFVAGNGATITASAKTDSHGEAVASLQNTKMGVSPVTATVRGNSQTVDTHFIADATTASGELVTIKDNAIADDAATNSVQLTLTDAHSNPLSGITINFTASNGVTVTTPSGQTDAKGQLSTTITSSTATTSTVTATNNNGEKLRTAITFIADSGSATINAGNLTVINDKAAANGSASNRVQAKITDAKGNPVPDIAVTFAATHSATITTSANTDKNGVAIASLQNTLAGISNVTATVNGNSQNIDTSFIADGASASGHFETVDNSAIADGAATDSVLLTITDAHNNPVPDVAVTFTASNGVNVTSASGSTDAAGKVTTTLTSTLATDSVITAKTTNGETLTTNVTFIADGGSATLLAGNMTRLADGAVANGTARNGVQVKITDGNGNSVPGITVTFSADNGAVIDASGTTDDSGTLRLPVTSKVAGMSNVTATVNGNSQSLTLTFVADSDTAQIVEGALTLVDDDAVADGVATNSVKAIVTDANGNRIVNTPVAFRAGNSATIAASATTDSNGEILTTLTNTRSGTSSVTATVATGSRSVDAHFKADDSTAQITSANMTVISNNAKADNISTNRVGVAVVDQFGNAVPDQTVQFTADNGANVNVSGTTNAEGWLVMMVTSNTAGDSLVTASINSSSQSRTVTFTADGDSAHIADGALKMIVNNATADGTDIDTVQATVTDGSGNLVEGENITFTADNGATITASGTTDANGQVSVKMTSLIAGNSKVIASVNGSSQSVNATFKADESTAKITSGALTVTADNATANGIATNRVQVKVTDKNNNPVPDLEVTFNASHDAVIAASGLTDSNGIVRMPVTNTSAGISTITATVNGSSDSVDTNFVADGNTAEILDGALTLVHNNALANGTDTNEVQATVTDAHNNPVAGITVTFFASRGAVIEASSVTDAKGQASATLTNTLAGNSIVMATANGSDRSVTATFKADDSTANITSGNLRITKDNAQADGIEVNRVRVIVTDQLGNAISGAEVAFSASNGALMDATGTTDGSGRIEMPLTNTLAGVSTVIASINGNSQQVDLTFIADSGTATVSSLTSERDGAVADGTATNTVKAHVADRNNNPIAQMDISFTASNGASIAATGTTDANGDVVMPLTTTTAGTSVVTASVNGDAKSVDTHFVADDSTAEIVAGNLSVTKDNAVADAVEFNRVRLLVTDKHGNAVPNADVTFDATNSAVIDATSKTDTNGVIVLPVTSQVAGVSTITAHINSSSQSVDMTFAANTGTARVATFTTEQDGAVADGVATNSVKAHVVDSNNNPVPDLTINFLALNGATITPSGTTDTNGDVAMTLTNTKAGDSVVYAQVNGNYASTTATFIPDSNTAEIVSGALKITANKATADGRMQNRVEVTVTDANGNVVESQSVDFTASNGAQIMPTGTTDEHGKINQALISTVAGISSVTATINGSSQSVDVTFIADNGTAGMAEGDLVTVDNNALANGAATNSVQATVKDSNDNPVENQRVDFYANNGASIVASDTTDTTGKVRVTLTSKTAGNSTVTATVNGQSRTTETTFVADGSTAGIADGQLTVTRNNAKADGTTSNRVRVNVTDSNGNPVGNVDVTFSADNSAVIAPAATTDDNGLINLPLTSVVAGISNVTATINGSSQSVPVTFVADSSSALIGSLEKQTDDALANGVATNSVKATVVDANGNVVPDIAISFMADNDAVIASSGTTDSNGEVVMALTSATAGTSNIRADVNGHEQWVAVNFKADGGTAQIVSGNLTVTRDNALANGTERNRVYVSVTDAKGNPVPQQTVSFTASNGAAIAATGETDDSGTLTMPVTNTLAGESTVTASINSSSQSVVMNFKADSNTADILEGNLVMVNDGAIADGIATNSVQATVTDANDNRVPQTTVNFSADNGATIVASGVTDDNGQVTVTLTSETSGISKITASVNSGSSSTDATFVADDSSAGLLAGNMTVTKDNALANGTEYNRVRVLVTDAKNNPVPNVDVAFSADNSASVAASGKTGNDGVIEMQVTSSVAGSSNITASINASTQTVAVNFNADTNTAQVTRLDIITNNAVADGNATNSVKATVKDGKGNLIPNIAVQFMSDNGAVITPSAQTDSNGEVTVTLTNETAGVSNILAEVNGYELWTAVTFTANPDTAEIGAGEFKVTKNFAIADGVEFNRVYVNVTDAFNNPVPNAEVQFTADNSAVIVASATTDSEGVISLPVTSIVAGVSNITATINGKSQSVPVTFMADSNSAGIAEGAMVVVTNGVAANGTATNRVEVTVTDNNGNLIADEPVSFSIAEGATVITTQGQTDANGKMTTDIISLIAGTYAVSATVNGNVTSKDVTFIADASTMHIASVKLNGSVVSKLANGTDNFTYTANVSDANNNPLPGVTVTWAQESGNDVTLTASSISDGNGLAVATLTSSKNPALNVMVSAALADGNSVNADKSVSFKARMVTMHGKVTNAVDGKSIQGATIDIYASKEDSDPAYQLTSDKNGSYSMSIDAGSYYVRVNAEGFIEMGSDMDVQDVTDYEKNFALSPTLDGKVARIVLTWDESPKDLDSYLMVPKKNYPKLKDTIYYSNKKPSGADAYLDLDDTTSFGPETITIDKTHSGVYCYLVNRYSSKPKTMTGARVKVYITDGRILDYSWDSASGSESAENWAVFELDTTGGTMKINDLNKRQSGKTCS
jgi:hypothetical protein